MAKPADLNLTVSDIVAGKKIYAPNELARFQDIESKINAVIAAMWDGADIETYAGGGLTDDDTVIPTSKAVLEYLNTYFSGSTWAFRGYMTSNKSGASFTQRDITAEAGGAWLSGQVVTVPKDGQYTIRLNVMGAHRPGSSCQARLKKNGTQILLVDTVGGGTTWNFTYTECASGELTSNLDNGDTITLEALASGTDGVCYGIWTNFSIIRLGDQV